MRKLLAVFFLAIAGCMAVGRDFAAPPVRNIQNNVTTKDDIFTSFGEPVRRGLENGLESWTYSYQKYEFLQLRDFKELHLLFNKDNTVRSYSFTTR